MSRLAPVKRDGHKSVQVVDQSTADGMTAGMTATQSRENRVGSRAAAPNVEPEQVHIQVTPDDARTLHRSIPRLVDEARRLLAPSRGTPRRDLVVDLSAVPPTPIAAPLILLVNLLRRLVGDGRIDVIGVSPAIAGALTAFDLPDDVTLTDTRGRRWPG